MKESLAHDLTSREEVSSLNSSELAYEIVAACNDAKGKDVTVLEVSEVFDLSDFFVVTSARSDRQVQGIANRLIETMAHFGMTPVTIEGMDQGHWVLLDFGEVVAHIFYEPIRSHYDVESLWVRAKRVELKKGKKGIKAKVLPTQHPVALLA